MSKWVLGVIGGSGFYDLPLDDEHFETITTNWGQPSDDLRCGKLSGVEVVFLPRHGRGHTIPPSAVNYRANIAALKMMGATDILSLSACGSFREELGLGHFVIIDQFIDRTFAREKSFFDPGCVVHVPLAEPVSSRLGDFIEAGAQAENIPYHRGGIYLAMEGPQFSTRAESELYRQWGCDVVGMTNMPEAKLAREAELPYATIAMVTDYDCWRWPQISDFEVVLKTLSENTQKAMRLVVHLAANLPSERDQDPQGLDTILDMAVITSAEARAQDFAMRYAPIITRFAKTEKAKTEKVKTEKV